jgi:hypothetical protein
MVDLSQRWLALPRKKRLRMAVLFTRSVAVPVWIIVFAFVVVFATPPFGIVAKMLLLVVGGLVVAAAVLFLGKSVSHPTIFNASTSPSADFVPNSWPNSGFRNSRQRGTRGR